MNLAWKDRRWHVRLYLWAEPVVAKFFDTYSRTEGVDSIRTNLCPYMRTLLLWLPLALAVNLLTLAVVVVTAVVLPTRLFGWGGYLGTLMTIGSIILIFMGIDALRDSYKRRAAAREDLPKPSKDATPGFASAFGMYAHKVHEGICPGVTIERSGGSR